VFQIKVELILTRRTSSNKCRLTERALANKMKILGATQEDIGLEISGMPDGSLFGEQFFVCNKIVKTLLRDISPQSCLNFFPVLNLHSYKRKVDK
jgi:hypothetical protein